MHIEFVDLKRQNRIHWKEFTKTVDSVIAEANFISGKPVTDFESAFAAFCGKKYCIGLNSGTDALFFALLAYGIKPGDEVITVPNSYFATAMVISNVGATPVFVDINPKNYNIDVTKIEQAITRKTKAIIPVHLYGQPADMDPIIGLAKKYHLHIVEDCCQAHNAQYKKKRVPITETGAFSFYPGKNLGSFGDGGAVVTNNPDVEDMVERLRTDGAKQKYVHTMFGYKSRLDTIQAAVLVRKLKHLEEFTEKRRRAAQIYNSLLQDIPHIYTPKEMPYARHVYHIYAIETDKRDALQKHLEKHDIATVIHYPTPIHLQAPYRKVGFKEGDFLLTERQAKCILSLPMFPEITKKEIAFVVKTIKQFFA